MWSFYVLSRRISFGLNWMQRKRNLLGSGCLCIWLCCLIKYWWLLWAACIPKSGNLAAWIKTWTFFLRSSKRWKWVDSLWCAHTYTRLRLFHLGQRWWSNTHEKRTGKAKILLFNCMPWSKATFGFLILLCYRDRKLGQEPRIGLMSFEQKSKFIWWGGGCLLLCKQTFLLFTSVQETKHTEPRNRLDVFWATPNTFCLFACSVINEKFVNETKFCVSLFSFSSGWILQMTWCWRLVWQL